MKLPREKSGKKLSMLKLLIGVGLISAFGLSACKTMIGGSDSKDHAGYDIEKSWAQTLSQDLKTAKSNAEDLSNTRETISDAESLEETIEAIGDHHQRIIDVSANLEVVLNKMKEKMKVPRVSSEVKDVARVSNDEYMAQVNAVEELTKPNGSLDTLSLASGKFYAISAASVAAPNPVGADAGSKQGQKVAARKAVIEQIKIVNGKIDGIITAVTAWIVAANQRGSIGAPVTPPVVPVDAVSVQTRLLSAIFVERTPYDFFLEANYNTAAAAAKQKCEAWLAGIVLPAGAKVRLKSCSTPTQVVAKENSKIAAQVEASLKIEFPIPSKAKLTTITESFTTRSEYDFYLEPKINEAAVISVKKCNDKIALIKEMSKANAVFAYCEPPFPVGEYSVEGYKDSKWSANAVMKVEFTSEIDESQAFPIDEKVSCYTSYDFYLANEWNRCETAALASCKARAGEVLASRPGAYGIILQCIGPMKTLSPNGRFAVTYSLKGTAVQPD